MKRSASENIWLVIKYVLLIGFTIVHVFAIISLLFIYLQTNPNYRAYEKKLLLIISIACIIWDIFSIFS